MQFGYNIYGSSAKNIWKTVIERIMSRTTDRKHTLRTPQPLLKPDFSRHEIWNMSTSNEYQNYLIVGIIYSSKIQTGVLSLEIRVLLKAKDVI